MTPDLDEIRAALAEVPYFRTVVGETDSRRTFVQNAPVWLVWCIEEIERLRAELADLEQTYEDNCDGG